MKRKLAFLCGTLALFAGCTAAPVSSTPQPEASPMEITVGFWNAQELLQQDAVQRYIESRFNVTFVPVNMNYENYTTVLQQLASSDQLPDIFASDIIGTSAYESWITQGRIRQIPQDLTDYPHLQEYLSGEYMQQSLYNGSQRYAIPRLTYHDEDMWALDRCLIVRRDWMEALHLDPPESWEDFEEILHAFVFGDPDGNAMDDTCGLTAVNLSLLETLYLNWFPELCYTERGWMYENEQWIPVYASENTGEALALMQRLYRKGLLDEQLAYANQAVAVNKFLDGKAGAICIQYSALVQAFAERGRLEDAARQIQVLLPWPAQDGNRYRFTTSLHWSESYFGSSVDNAKMARILEIYDWLLSDEFDQLFQYGLNDTGDGIRTADNAPAVSPMLQYPSLYLFNCLVEWDQEQQYQLTPSSIQLYGEDNIRYAQELLTWYSQNTERVYYNDTIKNMSTPAKNNLLNNYAIQDEMLKVIVGEENAATAWPQKLEQLNTITPLQQAIREVNEKANELGIVPPG